MKRISDLAAAIDGLNRHALALQNEFILLGRYSEGAEQGGKRLQEIAAAADKKKEEIEEANAPIEKHKEELKALEEITRLVPDTKFAQFALMSDNLQDKLRSIREVHDRGLLSEADTAKAIHDTTEEYHNLKAAAEGRMLGGEAGAKLAMMARKPVATAAGFAGGQFAGIGQGLMGIMQSTPLGGGLFGLLMHGYREMDRMKAEAGEVANIINAASGKAVAGSVQHFAAFQEYAQKQLGISRQEVQGSLKVFIDGGVEMRDILKAQEPRAATVGKDAVQYTLALDKQFEWGGGTSARLAMQLVANKGETIESATGQLTRMAFHAQRAGAGTQDFVQSVVKAAVDLAQFGIDAESIAAYQEDVIGRYKELGVNGEVAAGYARAGLGEVTQGLNAAPLGIQARLGEELGMGQGLEARFALHDAVNQRDKKRFAKIVMGLSRIAQEETKGTGGGSDNTRQRSYLESAGFGFEGARLIIEMGKKMHGGKLEELTSSEWKALDGAFTTEAQKMSDMAKSRNELLGGMAQVGQGMLQVVSNFAAIAIVSIKALMSMDYVIEGGAMVVGALFAPIGTGWGGAASETVRALGGGADPAREARMAGIKSKFTQYMNAAGEGAALSIDGIVRGKGAIEKVMGPILDPVARALRFKVGAHGEVVPELIMDDEMRINQALYGDVEDQDVRQTKTRDGMPAVVSRALGEVGAKIGGEEPNKYSRGRAEWWCMDFVGWAYEQEGYAPWGTFENSMWGTYQFKGYKGMEAWARDTGHWRDPTSYVPKPGDIFFLERWTGATPGEGVFVGEHVGMVVDILEDGTLLTVEGNAQQGGVNGVWQHKRDPGKSMFRGFITTEKSGGGRASADAKRAFLRKAIRTAEMRKKHVATTVLRKRVTRARQDAAVQKVAEKAAEKGGVGFSPGAEGLVSTPETDAALNAQVRGEPITATLTTTTEGPAVTISIDPAVVAAALAAQEAKKDLRLDIAGALNDP
jgi:hypothetical protein